MHGASVALVEQVVAQVLAEAPLTQQADLPSILGVFAEPLITAERFVALVGKEKLMASDLITSLVDEKVAELEKKYADELKQTRTALYRALQELVEDAVILRFPNTPAVLVRNIRSLTDQEQLASLRRAILQAPDQPAVEALLAAIPTAA